MRSPTPPPPVAGDSPRVGDRQGSTWRPEIRRVSQTRAQAETYTLFRTTEIFAGERSARIRRLEAEMVNLQLGDVYDALALPWQVTRSDVNAPHGNDWEEGLVPDFWVSTDTGKICFAPLADGAGQVSQHGQYHKTVGGEWQHFPTASRAPGNVGGFHACTVDTGQPGTSWTLIAKLADFGLALGRDAGLRTEFAALVRDDAEAVIASVGPHDECRSLFSVDQVTLERGSLLLADPAELAGLGDGPAVPSGIGAGYYPAFVSRDENHQICRISVVFHPGRAVKICSRFPPIPTAPGATASSTASTAAGSSGSATASSSAASGLPPRPPLIS